MNTPRPAALMQASDSRPDPAPDPGRQGTPGACETAAPPMWTRGELALFHPYYHDDWADEFVTLACDDEVWGFGDMLSLNRTGAALCKTR